MESKLPDVGTTIFTVMSALANEHKAINLSQGFPDFPIAPALSEAVSKALRDDQVQYAPMPGRLDLREAIAKIIADRRGVTLNPGDEITITAGATEAIFNAIAAVVRPGDEVILFDPAYDCYDPSIRLFGGIPIHLELSFPSFQIDWELVRTKVNAKTKLIIVNNPHNPTGSVWGDSDLNKLEELVRANSNLLVISDEVYEFIQFEGVHQSVLSNEFLRNRSFVVYSFGKTLHVTGWKLGYCVAPPLLTLEFRKVHQFNVFCVNNTMQAAVANYLQSGNAQLQDIAPFYRQKRDLFLEGMKTSRFKALPCEGTYFCLMDYSALSDLSDVEFAKYLTTQFGVASIPVSVFYQAGHDNKLVRFCFAKRTETLTSAIERLCRI